MTREEMMAIVLDCSGMAGEIEFNRLSKVEFIKWFRENIKYNTPKSREEGKKVLHQLWHEVKMGRRKEVVNH